MDINTIARYTAYTGGDYSGKRELERLDERKSELMGKLGDIASGKNTDPNVNAKDVVKDLKEVTRRSLETQLEEDTHRLEAQGQQNLIASAKAQRQRSEERRLATGQEGAVLSDSLISLLKAGYRHEAVTTYREPEEVKKGAAAPAQSGTDGLKKDYDSLAGYETRRYARNLQYHMESIGRDLADAVATGNEEAAFSRRLAKRRQEQEQKNVAGIDILA